MPLAGRAQCPDCGGAFPAGLLPPMSGSASDFAPRRAGAEAGADVRIAVATDGVYRVTGVQLSSAGIDISALHGSQLRLFCRTQEVAVQVSTSGVLGSNDFVQFYGVAHRGYYTITNVYWLGAGGGSGLRMDVLDASTNAGGAAVTTHCATVRYDPDARWNGFYRPDDESLDHWFAIYLASGTDSNAVVTTDARRTNDDAAIVLKLHGITSDNALNPDHRTRVRVGGTAVTNVLFDGQQGITATGRFSAALLTDGATTVSLAQTQSSNTNTDRAYLEEFAVSYTRALRARNGQLAFCGAAGTNIYAVSGFATNAGFVVLDVTDPASAVALTNWSVAGGPTDFTLSFRAASAAPRRFQVTRTNNILSAASVKRMPFRNLADPSRQADYILICPYAFREPAYRLLKHRSVNGLSVAVAPLEDVYSEFGYGIEDAAAIKQFLGYAFHHWQGPPPRYVCLAGEGTYDPKNGLGLNSSNLLPVHEGPTPYTWTAQDNWYTTVNGPDNLPDMAVGRIAVSSAAELAAVQAKIVRFESTNHFKGATLVADNVDGSLNFKAASQNYIYTNLAPDGYAISKQYLDDTPSTSAVRTAIRSTINGGRHVVTFFGHSATLLDFWCQENVWNTNDIALLTNTVCPIVTVFSCANAWFHFPGDESMAEAFVERQTNGAVACVAPTALSVQIYAEQVADGFFDEFTNTNARLGDALDAGLLRLWQYNPVPTELLTYETIGDPGLKIH